MEPLKSYLTKEGWKKDLKKTIERIPNRIIFSMVAIPTMWTMGICALMFGAEPFYSRVLKDPPFYTTKSYETEGYKVEWTNGKDVREGDILEIEGDSFYMVCIDRNQNRKVEEAWIDRNQNRPLEDWMEIRRLHSIGEQITQNKVNDESAEPLNNQGLVDEATYNSLSELTRTYKSITSLIGRDNVDKLGDKDRQRLVQLIKKQESIFKEYLTETGKLK